MNQIYQMNGNPKIRVLKNGDTVLFKGSQAAFDIWRKSHASLLRSPSVEIQYHPSVVN